MRSNPPLQDQQFPFLLAFESDFQEALLTVVARAEAHAELGNARRALEPLLIEYSVDL